MLNWVRKLVIVFVLRIGLVLRFFLSIWWMVSCCVRLCMILIWIGIVVLFLMKFMNVCLLLIFWWFFLRRLFIEEMIWRLLLCLLCLMCKSFSFILVCGRRIFLFFCLLFLVVYILLRFFIFLNLSEIMLRLLLG